MLTRSKVRKFKLVSSTNSRMADSNENNGGSDIEFDINNQMGEKGWEEATESESPEVSSEARGRRQNDDVRSETEQTQSQTETQQTATNIDISRLLQQFTQQMTENTKRLLIENNQQMTENINRIEQKLTENTRKLEKNMIEKLNENTKKNEENTEQLKQTFTQQLAENNQQITENITRIEKRIDDMERNMEQRYTQQLQEHKTQIAQQIQEIRNENRETAIQLRTEVKEVVREEVEIVRSEAKEHWEKCEESLQQHQASVAYDIRAITNKMITHKKKNEEQIEQLKECYENSCSTIDGKISKIKEDVRNKIAQIERTPRQQGVIIEHTKNVNFNGEGEYPMEFVKELEEIHREYYPGEEVSWIGRHLDGEAAIWWKLIRNEVNTFEQFQTAFTAKYWNQMIQESVRDKLEFGKYRPESGLSMTQYMERCILQNRQLIPPMSDLHLIRKLAHHYSHDIAVACITRGVNNIMDFQNLLMEFAALRQKKNGTNGEGNMQFQPKQERNVNNANHWPENRTERSNPPRHKAPWRQGEKTAEANERERAPQKRVYESQMNTLASTSGTQGTSQVASSSNIHTKNVAQSKN